MKYANQLQKLGFNENEATVYVACLRVGNARVARIAKEAGLPKSTTKDTLDALHARGFVSRYKNKNRFHFSPADPETLTAWLDRRKSLLDDLLPKLKSTQFSAKQQSNVRSYFDKQGFSSVEREILSEAKEVLLISPGIDLDQHASDYFPKFMARRLEQRIRARILIEESPIAKRVQAHDATTQQETRTLRPPIPFESIMFMWGKKVAVVSLETPVTIVVLENESISQMLTSLFELLWENVSKG